MSAGDRDALAAVLLDALKQQPDAVDGWHSPWVSDVATPAGCVQVDGDLNLNILADVLLASDWLRERDDAKWCEGYHAGDIGDFRNPYRRTTEDH